MIVNVSPSPVVFDETVGVFEFSSIAKEVASTQQIRRRVVRWI